jgi:uncharacterized protein YbjQ (UPF0145 family)
MGLFDLFRRSDPEARARQAESEARQAEILRAIKGGAVPEGIRARLDGARAGTLPWTATLNPAELAIVRSHGLRPIAAVSATCWLHYGYSWTKGHSEGWGTALRRLRDEAHAAGANAVLDVKMRTIPLRFRDNMDFTLIGTAVRVEGLPPNPEPLVATVPALEFVKLLEAEVIPTGIAVGADYEILTDWSGTARKAWGGNVESPQLSELWQRVRDSAHAELRANARGQGNGVLAHVNFSQSFEFEDQNDRKNYLARHIVVATTVDARKRLPGDFKEHEVQMVLDLCGGATPLIGRARHHQSYASNESEGAI